MRIAVCEDNAGDRAFLCTYIRGFCERGAYSCDIEEFGSGEALLERFEPGLFPVVLLDIYLPGMSGMDLARRIREVDNACAILFLTVSTDHALEGFGVMAAGYVVKPLMEEKLERALLICRESFERSSRLLRVPVNGGELELPVAGVRFVEVYNKSTLFHMESGVVEARISLDKVERALGGMPFLRCHRSYLVNLNHVEAADERELRLRGGDAVPIRKHGAREIRLAYARFLAGAREVRV